MTMKLMQLTGYWQAGDAQLIIEFLDELKAVLCTHYQQDITDMQGAMKQTQRIGKPQLEFKFEDEPGF